MRLPSRQADTFSAMFFSSYQLCLKFGFNIQLVVIVLSLVVVGVCAQHVCNIRLF